MKALRLLFFWVWFCMIFNAQPQNPTNLPRYIQDVIKNKITNMLVEDGILNRVPTNQDDEILRNYLENWHYPLPRIHTNSPIRYFFKDYVNFSALGSFILTKETIPPNIQLDQNSRLPLPFLAKSNQMFTRDWSKFELFINSSSIIAKALGGNAAANVLRLLRSKAEMALRKTTTTHSELNFAVGTFENRLATIMEGVKKGSDIKSKEWLPVFDLWKYYSTPNSVAPCYLINFFTGMIVYELRNVTDERSKLNRIIFEGGLNLPFFSAQAETNLNWQKGENFRASETIYDIYMTEEPHFTLLPDYKRILSFWDSLGPTYSTIVKYNDIDESQRRIILEPDRPTEILFKFGPIPPEYANEVELDWEYTINSFKGVFFIETSNSQWTMVHEAADPQREDYHFYKLTIRRNEDYFRTQSEFNPQRINFRLRFKTSVNVNGTPIYLKRDYDNIEVTSTTLPNITNIKPLYLHDGIENGTYKWRIPISIEQISKQKRINWVMPSEWQALNQKFSNLTQFLPQPDFTLARENDSWVLEFSLPLQQNSATNNERIIFNGKLFISEGSNPPVLRSIRLCLKAPQEIVIAESKVNYSSSDLLVESLRPDVVIEDKNLYQLKQDLRNQLKEAGVTEDQIEIQIKEKIKEKLLENKLIEFDPNKGYFINKKLTQR